MMGHDRRFAGPDSRRARPRPRDVTKKRANRQRQIIERMDRLLAAGAGESALAG